LTDWVRLTRWVGEERSLYVEGEGSFVGVRV